ncbi:glycosyl hydrolase family 8 [Humitalea sp. 24SJ18S-53]|uniref:glycosyl hydrolase family 8 n=1 Tax=Humitalea sp. 24SJ18S-53 TaxID=3422307 RepID=UPI003D67598C
MPHTPGGQIRRRAFVLGAAAGAGAWTHDEWALFKTRFLAPDGRVVDTGNGGISHSEGQGWALLAAMRSDDRDAFDRILRWTRTELRRPGDHLTAWKFRPGLGVEDTNNASDGDIFIGASLIEAGRRWGDPRLTAQGIDIARDILRLLVRRTGALTVLLPGARGFEREGFVVLNPSYYAFPGLRVLAGALPDPRWIPLVADGLALLRAARFGRWGLPPDWLAVSRRDGGLSLPHAWPPRFSYDAVRVPLYLAWAGLGDEPACRAAAAFWSDPRHRELPAWTDLVTDAVSPYAATAGIAAVAGLVTRGEVPPGSIVAAADDYYGAALGLLTRMAWRDRTR